MSGCHDLALWMVVINGLVWWLGGVGETFMLCVRLEGDPYRLVHKVNGVVSGWL